MSIDIKVRSALSADIIALVGLDHTCESNYVWQLDLRKEAGEVNITLREVRLPRSVRVKYPRDHFSLADEWKKNSRTFVAVSEGIPLGYIRFLEQGTAESIWVLDLVILTEARRKGVATRLIQFVEGWALERKYTQLFIEMSSKNHPAISFVKKMGFEFSGYNEHYYATKDVALFFGKLLKEF
ncbi:MAG: GNAT family N-acetyltransferase [Anaerolineae bacterium]|jgi:GNAT superfamily N-acetyltransferase|nr:GNAT family N-acetyltransferase [Anaerolineae bacterium]